MMSFCLAFKSGRFLIWGSGSESPNVRSDLLGSFSHDDAANGFVRRRGSKQFSSMSHHSRTMTNQTFYRPDYCFHNFKVITVKLRRGWGGVRGSDFFHGYVKPRSFHTALLHSGLCIHQLALKCLRMELALLAATQLVSLGLFRG